MINQNDLRNYNDKSRIIIKDDAYIYLLPHQSLRPYISNYTITFPSAGIMSDDYTVIPHGCGTLVIEREIKNLSITLFGSDTKPMVVGESANRCEMLVIIEFQPMGLYGLTGINQSELLNQIFSFDEINPVLTHQLLDIVERSTLVEEIINSLDKLLYSNLYTELPPQLRQAMQNIIGNFGNVTVKNLSESNLYSERQFNRLFKEHVGMSPKLFSKIVRVNKALRLLGNRQLSLIEISNIAGFHDQPHFIRNFKSICGITPQLYRQNMSDFYNEIAKF